MDLRVVGYPASTVRFEGGLRRRKDAPTERTETPTSSKEPPRAPQAGSLRKLAHRLGDGLGAALKPFSKKKEDKKDTAAPLAKPPATTGRDLLQAPLPMDDPGYLRSDHWGAQLSSTLGIPHEPAVESPVPKIESKPKPPPIVLRPPSPSASSKTSPFHLPPKNKPVVDEKALKTARTGSDSSLAGLSLLGEELADRSSKLRRRDTSVNYQPQPLPGGRPEYLPTLEPLSSPSIDFEMAESSDSTRSSDTGGTGRVSGAVINPDTGALDKRHLRQLIGGLVDALPPVPEKADRRAAALHAALVSELRAIGRTASDDSRLPPHKLGLAVRDGFERASKASRALATSLNKRESLLSRQRPNKDAAVAYLGVAGLLNELKRTHLSAAAADVAGHYVDKEMDNLDRAAHGILGNVPGSNVATSKGASLDVNYLGAKGGIGGSSGRVLFKDDPYGDWNFWTSYSGYVKGGYGWNVKGWALGLTGKLGLNASGTYLEQSDPKDMLLILSNFDANRTPGRSAGPRARRTGESLQKLYAGFARGVLGRNYVPAPGHPSYLSDAKIAKGFNAARRDLIASMLDAQMGDQRFSRLMGTAYPDISDLLGERLAARQQMPLPTRRDVPLSAAYRDLAKWFAYQQESFNVEGKAGKGTPGKTMLEAAGAFVASGTMDRLRFNPATEAPPHRLLGVGYHRDFKATLGLVRDIERLRSAAPRQFYLYDRVRRALAGDKPAQAPKLNERQRLFYGDEIPDSLREAIAHPDAAKLDRVAQVTNRIASAYTRFAADAQVLLSQPDRQLAEPAKAELKQRRQQAFERIQQAVWNGEYPGGLKAALKHPERFVSQSYASLSLALGRAGVELSVLKHEIGQSEALHTEANKAAILKADEAYQSARDMLDGIYLPLKAFDVIGNGPLRDKATWQRWQATVKAAAGGGAKANALGALLGRWHKSMGPVSVTNEAGQVVLSAEAQYQYADKQVNPVRLGHFLQLTFTAQGGAPLTGIAMNKAIAKVIEKLNGTKLPEDRLDASEVMRQLQGLVLDQTDGTRVVVKLHRSPGLPRLDLQYLRVLRVKNSGLNASVPIPIVTPAGPVIITPGVSHTDSATGALGELVGKDLDYQILRYPQLGELLTRAGGGRKAMRTLFDRHPDVKLAYFGFDDTLLTTLQRYADYRQAKLLAQADGRRLGGHRMLNGFERYYESEPFARVARVSEQVKSYAPGATSGGGNPFKQPVGLTDGPGVTIPDLAAARKALAGLKSVDERADFFCSPQGWPLLCAYRDVMEGVCSIKTNAFFHTAKRDIGFQTKLRDKKLARQGSVTQAAVYGAQPKGWWATLRPQQAAARRLTLSELRILARNPKARPAVRQELLRRSKVLGRDVSRAEHDDGPSVLDEFVPPSGGKASIFKPASSASSSSSSSTSIGGFDARGAREAVRLLQMLPGWGANGASDAGPVRGMITATRRTVADPVHRARAEAQDAETRDYMDNVAMPRTRIWLAQQGIAVVPNRGDQLNCLIIALLQHATRRYGSEHHDAHAASAAKYRRMIQQRFPDVGRQMLLPDDPAFKALVKAINRDNGTSMQVEIAQPGPNGHPVLLPTIPTGTDPVALLQGFAHYEALTMAART